MTGNLRVFVSSTCNDLFQERRDIAASVLAAGHSVIVSELPKQMPVNPYLSCIENCLDAVSKYCDVLVVVISGSYGSFDSSGKSITLQEYLRARELRIPIITFVRQKILDLLPIFQQTPTASFSPVVSDNRLFEFIARIMEEQRGNWVFGFTDAESIAEALKFQLSCLLRARLVDRPPLLSQAKYLHISNSTQLLRKDGSCIRTLEYVVRNDTSFPIERLYGGDHSDRPMSFADMELKILDERGTAIDWKPLVETPGFRRWDIVLRQPLLPGETFTYSTSFNSCDVLQMQTWVNHPVQAGLIKYFMPHELVEAPLNTAIRDPSGWRNNPPEVSVREINGINLVVCPFHNDAGFFQFRLTWGQSDA